jgi:hypothetical protein
MRRFHREVKRKGVDGSQLEGEKDGEKPSDQFLGLIVMSH